jgi:hypothetical protein
MKAGIGFARVRTICRIHRSFRNDPFRIFAEILGGKPKPIGVRCQRCRQPVHRAYTQAQVTGWVFGYYACACTMVSQLSHIADPTSEGWNEMVAEANRLVPGTLKVHGAIVKEIPDFEGTN